MRQKTILNLHYQYATFKNETTMFPSTFLIAHVIFRTLVAPHKQWLCIEEMKPEQPHSLVNHTFDLSWKYPASDF